MEMVEINVERRDGRGKGDARKLRRAGVIPAVFYGPQRSALGEVHPQNSVLNC